MGIRIVWNFDTKIMLIIGSSPALVSSLWPVCPKVCLLAPPSRDGAGGAQQQQQSCNQEKLSSQSEALATPTPSHMV